MSTMNYDVRGAFATLSTAAIADACLRHGVKPRLAPPGTRPVASGSRLAGRARPVRHHGSVDVFLATIDTADAGDVLVIDNGGRGDEGCVGDLVVLEATAAGLAGIVVWGCHRDTPGLLAIDLPVFSLGACPAGPRRAAAPGVEDAPMHIGVEPMHIGAAPVHIGAAPADATDLVFADDDGVVFVAHDDLAGILATAEAIRRVEQEQADELAHGRSLREQFQFGAYVAARQRVPAHTFRAHLQQIGRAIEV